MWKQDHPSQNENEYFARRDAEWLKEQRALLDARRSAKAQEMICPRCGKVLAHRPFGGVTLDTCGHCHGVWLDAGELAMLAHEPERELLRLARELDGRSR